MVVRWTEEAAHRWYDALPWQSGCNFAPSYAINQLEMWQEATFDLAAIDAELALAASLGMNSARVYLHDLLWLQDAQGFLGRIDAFLTCADAHGIRPLFVLFDSCWDPDPQLGPQREPIPGVHNSGWVQAPGMKVLKDKSQHGRLRDYVLGVVGRFANDARVLAWDIWNEPDNGPDVSLCDPLEWRMKGDLVRPLMVQAFGWARQAGATQPLTSGIWMGDWSKHSKLSKLQQAQIEQSDIVSFHNYGDADDFTKRVGWLQRYGRPVICTEYMARAAGSTFQAILPVAHEHRIGMYCWGLVRGKTQTHLPWANWVSPLEDFPAEAWFHDIFDTDGSPHDEAEVEYLRMMHRLAHYAGVEVAEEDAPVAVRQKAMARS
jgi:hypothetical protein